MPRRAALLLTLAAPFWVAPMRAQAAPERVTRSASATLRARLTTLVDEEPFDRALWGIVVVDPNGRTVYDLNGDRLFTPASNTKLVVAAVAAALLGPGYRFLTSVYATRPLADSVLDGDLVLYGRGDPTLSDRFYPTRLRPFELLAEQLQVRGLTRVTGDLVADASWFDSVAVHPSWETYDVNWWYGAQVTALGFNDNAVDFRITPGIIGAPPIILPAPDLDAIRFSNRARTVPADSPRTLDFFRQPGTNVIWAQGDVPVDARPWVENFAVADGPAWAGAAFRRALADRGITVSGQVRVTYDPAATAEARAAGALAELRSPPLSRVLEAILEDSHNWYAEMLVKTLGREQRGTGSWRAGLDVERRFLVDSLRLDPESFRLADGSGLSHWNLVTPRAFTDLLRAMRRHRNFETFRDALPVAGQTGTLRTRFRRTGLQGRVRAKTGSIANTNTLSGYVETASGTWTFSIQINNHTGGSRNALRRIDEIVAAFVN